LILDGGASSLSDYYEATIAQLGVESRSNQERLVVQQQFVDGGPGAVLRRRQPGTLAQRMLEGRRQRRQGLPRPHQSRRVGSAAGPLLARQAQGQLGIECVATGQPGALLGVVQPLPQGVARGAVLGVEGGGTGAWRGPAALPGRVDLGQRAALRGRVVVGPHLQPFDQGRALGGMGLELGVARP